MLSCSQYSKQVINRTTTPLATPRLPTGGRRATDGALVDRSSARRKIRGTSTPSKPALGSGFSSRSSDWRRLLQHCYGGREIRITATVVIRVPIIVPVTAGGGHETPRFAAGCERSPLDSHPGPGDAWSCPSYDDINEGVAASAAAAARTVTDGRRGRAIEVGFVGHQPRR